MQLAPAPDTHVLPISPESLSAAGSGLERFLTSLGVSPASPLEVLVPNGSSRPRTNSIHSSMLSAEVPPGTFYELTPGADVQNRLALPQDTRILIDGPEFAIVRSAYALERMVVDGMMSPLAAKLLLLEFADECCGSYVRDPINPRRGAVSYDEPNECTRLMTPDDLASFLSSVRGLDGLKLARRIAPHVIDLSGSPMESYLNHAISLPPRLGGVSMLKPLANQQLVLDAAERGLLRHTSLRPDLQWPDQHMLAEYYGDESHSGKEARMEDKNRLLDYASTSYVAFPLMYDDIRDAKSFARTAEMLAREFTKRGVDYELYRVRKLLKDPEFLARQRILMATLLPPVARYDELA